MTKTLLFFLLSIFSIPHLSAQDDLNSSEKAALDQAGVSESDINTALKQTLSKSVDESAKDVSQQKLLRSNSLFGSDVPSDLKKLVQILNQNGHSDDITKLEDEINSKIPNMSDDAKKVFSQYVNNTDFRDAYHILMGDKNAATEYLKTHSGDAIEGALKPAVQQILNVSGIMKDWTVVTATYNTLTGQHINLDLAQYITHQLVENMFHKMSEEESKIRLNQFFWGSLIMKKVMSLQKIGVR